MIDYDEKLVWGKIEVLRDREYVTQDTIALILDRYTFADSPVNFFDLPKLFKYLYETDIFTLLSEVYNYTRHGTYYAYYGSRSVKLNASRTGPLESEQYSSYSLNDIKQELIASLVKSMLR